MRVFLFLFPAILMAQTPPAKSPPPAAKAATAAKANGAKVITLSGFLPENALRQLGDVNFYVPSTDYGSVELTHAALLHYLTDRLANA